MSTPLPRGLRLNNPGNIRIVAGVCWLGQAPIQSDESFVEFAEPVYGIRAMVRILRSYERAGISTIAGVIDRWAPPEENDSEVYASDVAAACAVDPDALVNIQTLLPAILPAMILHEQGVYPYSDELISQGISLAATDA